MQLQEITPNTNYNNFAGKVFDFGIGKFRIEQRFNDKDTDFGILQMYKSWGLKGHDGLDLTNAENDNIYAFFSGKVVFCDWFYNLNWVEKKYFTGGGRIVIIYNNNKLFAYYHLASINVTLNQEVKRGDIIGKQGGSGFQDNAFSPHLHFKMFDCNENYDIQNLQNGFFGGLDPWPFLIRELEANNLNQQVDSMNKTNLINAINQKFIEPEKTNLINAVNNDDAHYLLAFAGSELRQMVSKLETDINTLNARYNEVLFEKSTLLSQIEELKKNLSQEQNQNQNPQSVETNQILQEPQQNQNQSQVQAKTSELSLISQELQQAEKKSLLKDNKGRAVAGGGILSILGLSYLEPYLNQIGNLKPVFFNIIDSLRWWHIGIIIVVIGVVFMYRSKIQSEIQKALNNN